MMTSRKILDYIDAEPFRPFRVNMVSGKTYEIRHPEMIQIGKSTITVHGYNGDDKPETWRDISIILIESIEPISNQPAG